MKKVLFILYIFLFFIPFVNAEECSVSEKTKFMSDAIKVNVSYEFKTDESGRNYFAITIYNLSPNVLVSFYNQDNKYESVSGIDENLTYTFNDYDIDNSREYSFKIAIVGSGGCITNITVINLTKPKKNYYYENIPECKFQKMKDFYYCKEWINNDFHVDDYVIRRSIQEEFNKTTTSVSDEEVVSDNLVTFLQLYIKYRIYLLIGLGIGIIIDIVYIYLSYKRIKEGEF